MRKTSAKIFTEDDVWKIASQAKAAARELMVLSGEEKNRLLYKIADGLEASVDRALKANAVDVKAAEKKGLGPAFVDRLALNIKRMKDIVESVRHIAGLPDPTGEVLREWSPSNGMLVKQVRVPLGVIGMIYESRPNVTVESAALSVKSGNAVILRGGSEATHTNTLFVSVIEAALEETKLPKGAVQLLPPQDRSNITHLSRLNGLVDLIIARGSEAMIKSVMEKASVPVLGHGKGVCHIYVDESADIPMAVRVAFNAKVQRPGVCNAMEALLVHERIYKDLLPLLAAEYGAHGVEIRGDERVRQVVPWAKRAKPDDWGMEYHDKILAVKVVDSMDEAIRHINQYGSGHTDAIITKNLSAGAIFTSKVDSSCVMVNASTRLHDGGVFGFGSEIGISTNKLHARGTMGLRELTTTKYIVQGQGQIRE